MSEYGRYMYVAARGMWLGKFHRVVLVLAYGESGVCTGFSS